MTIRNYREEYDIADLPVDALHGAANEHRAPADWVSIPDGTAGDDVVVTTFHGSEEITYTVGADGITTWNVPGGVRSVDDLNGAGNETVIIGTGQYSPTAGPQGAKGDTGATGADGATGPAGPVGEPVFLESTIGFTADDFAGQANGVKTMTKVVLTTADNDGDLFLVGIEFLNHTPFTDGGAGTYSVILGDSGDDDKYVTATDVKAAVTAKVANAGIHMFPGKNLADLEIRYKITSSVDLNTATAGSLKVRMVCIKGTP